MSMILSGLCTLLLATGAGWAAWLGGGYRPEMPTAAGLGTAVVVSFLAYMTTDRKDAALWLRFGLYGGTLAVSLASLWTGVVRPLQHAPSFGTVVAWFDRLDGLGLVLLVAPSPAVVLLTVLWFEVAVATFRHLGGSGRRHRAESDLHGHATLLGRRFLRRLAKRRGILLGQWGGRPNAPLIGWSLEGSAITVAPPRTGKGALIALNLLSPDERGFDGSTVTIDPRGELWCIAARRRRELGRQAVLLDPFGVTKAHRKEEPFAGGLARIAVERQAQVGREEGGSDFTTVANQLAVLNYPELLASTARSSFDPLSLADGRTDLFVVAPEETVEHVKGWLRLWVAIPNAVAEPDLSVFSKALI